MSIGDALRLDVPAQRIGQRRLNVEHGVRAFRAHRVKHRVARRLDADDAHAGTGALMAVAMPLIKPPPPIGTRMVSSSG